MQRTARVPRPRQFASPATGGRGLAITPTTATTARYIKRRLRDTLQQQIMADAHNLTVLQHNLGHGRVATGELRTFPTRKKASILLLQEPWVNLGRICGLGTTSNRILTGCLEGTPLACIAILDN